MRYHSYTTEDRDYLEELLGYFPVSPPVSLDDAQKIIRNRCQSWDPFGFMDALTDEEEVEYFFNNLSFFPRFLNKVIFKDVLINAGEYRKKSDPNEGIVEFGLPVKDHRDGGGSSNGRFTGRPPDKIKDRVNSACRLLQQENDDPVRCAAEFYQKFIRIHPFYDGNGRIGRFMVDAYLYTHDMFIDWERMKITTRWIRQLNYCHRKDCGDEFQKAYLFALKWWAYYLRKFVHETPPE